MHVRLRWDNAESSHYDMPARSGILRTRSHHTSAIVAGSHVLDAGRVVERGRHDELVARDGRYADMWRRQQESNGGVAPRPEVEARATS